MQIKDSRFHKVWEIKEDKGFKKLNLGDSKKNKDGGYDSWTWFDVTLVGNAKNTPVDKGDTITINSGLFTQRKYKDKYYNDIVIFDFEVTKKGDQPTQNQYDNYESLSEEESEDIPF